MALRFLIALALLVPIATAIASFAVHRAIRRNPPPRHGRGRRKPDDLVPRGGGLAVIPVLAAAWLIGAGLGIAPAGSAVAALAMAGLAMLAVQDMRVGISPLYHYTAQAIAVVLGLIFLPGSGHVFQGLLPVTLDLVFTTVIWMGAMQAIPSSDRRDGLVTVWLISVGLGAAAVAFLTGDRDSGALSLGIAVAGVGLGYLSWAWPPAQLLLGTVGTIPLGYALAWLLLSSAGRGHWAASLILSAHLLGNLSSAARARFRARDISAQPLPPRPRRGKSQTPDPASILRRVALGEALMVALAALSTLSPWPALLAAGMAVFRLRRSFVGSSGLGFRGI